MNVPGLRRSVSALVALLLLAACEPLSGTPAPVGETRFDCSTVPGNTCRDVLADAKLNGSGAAVVELVVRCSTPPCTPMQGEADVSVRYADGGTLTWSIGWSGPVPAQPAAPVPPAAAPVEPTCVGVDPAMCLEVARQMASEVPAGRPPIVALDVRCTSVCTASKAEGEVLITLADGTTMTTGWAQESMESVGG